MSHSNLVISQPVSFVDVQSVIGNGSTDLGTLCKASQINKWAMYKPESYAKVGILTLAERQSTSSSHQPFGLTPQTNNKGKLVLNGYSGTDAQNLTNSGYTMSDIISANTEWAYTKPSGGANSPYRLADFDGYVHSARSPIFGWGDWELDKSEVQSILDKALTGYVSGNDGSWELSQVWGAYQKLSCRLTSNQYGLIGGGGDDMIPLSYMLGISTGSWRIAFGIDVGDSKMYIFASSWPLKKFVDMTSSTDAGKAFPSLGSNQYALYRMLSVMGSAVSKEFTCVPLLVNNVFMTQANINGSYKTLIIGASAPVVYSPASATAGFKIKLVTNSPHVDNITTWSASATTDGVFIVGRYNTGIITGTPPNQAAVQGLAVFLCTGKSFSGTKTLQYNVTYSFGIGSSRQTYTASGTVSITNSDTITSDGHTYVAKAIITPVPAVDVSSISRLTYA